MVTIPLQQHSVIQLFLASTYNNRNYSAKVYGNPEKELLRVYGSPHNEHKIAPDLQS
jgi:hypothetical protein